MTAENMLAGQDLTLGIGSTEVDSVQAIGEITLADDVVNVGKSTTVEDAFGGVTSDVVQPGQISLVFAEGQAQALVSQLGEAPATDGQAAETVTLAIKDVSGAVHRMNFVNAWARSVSSSDSSAAGSEAAIETVLIEFDDVDGCPVRRV
ncbi:MULTISPECIES: hypothetical protein [Streptomyces]|uniref:Phage tail protein n=1 Tax=Streptomyces silvae TaxID=2803812 RepID=A0ABU7ZUN2_9ACTN|nr:hypothetical protein [Streptomyces sp. ME02-6979-3A]MDX3326940.1 hypothetical protein [Streptomyces sp. ME02-6979-3A]